MFIFGQALLQPLIGAECKNVGCALSWLSHDSKSSSKLIACPVLSLERIWIKFRPMAKDTTDGHRFTNVLKMNV